MSTDEFPPPDEQPPARSSGGFMFSPSSSEERKPEQDMIANEVTPPPSGPSGQWTIEDARARQALTPPPEEVESPTGEELMAGQPDYRRPDLTPPPPQSLFEKNDDMPFAPEPPTRWLWPIGVAAGFALLVFISLAVGGEDFFFAYAIGGIAIGIVTMKKGDQDLKSGAIALGLTLFLFLFARSAGVIVGYGTMIENEIDLRFKVGDGSFFMKKMFHVGEEFDRLGGLEFNDAEMHGFMWFHNFAEGREGDLAPTQIRAFRTHLVPVLTWLVDEQPEFDAFEKKARPAYTAWYREGRTGYRSRWAIFFETLTLYHIASILIGMGASIFFAAGFSPFD